MRNSYKSRQILQNFSLLAIASIASLALFETFLQLGWDDGEVLIYELHPRYLHQIRPNIRKRYVHYPENGGHTVLSNFNRFGFRGPDIAVAKNGRFRVMVYGDSNISAIFSEEASTLPHRLQERLATLRDDVEVINAGVVGYGPDQVSLRLEDEIPVFDPDLLIVHVFAGNDFGDLIRNGIFSISENNDLVLRDYTLSAGLKLRMLLGRFKLARYARLVWNRYAQESLRSEPLSFPLESLRILTSEEMEAAYLSTGFHQAYLSYQSNNEVTNLFDDSGDVVNLFPDAEGSRYAIALMESVLRHMSETAMLEGVPLVVLIQPSPSDISTVAVAGPNYQHYLRMYPAYRQSRLTDIFQEICERNGIAYVNLYDTFDQNDPDSLHLIYDGHWNDRGQDLAAQVLFDFLSTGGYVGN